MYVVDGVVTLGGDEMGAKLSREAGLLLLADLVSDCFLEWAPVDSAVGLWIDLASDPVPS